MKKTVSVNINGISFHIDEDAFDLLHRYLKRVKSKFGDQYGGDEIIAGIEGRIAEIFHERQKTQGQVISIEDVRDAISQLGEPAQMSDDEQSQGNAYEKDNPDGDEKTSRRLFRDPDNKYIGGVCSGLAAYFDIDPTVVRLLFVVLIIAAGSTLWAYLILWIVIPKARTTAERLSMRGEKINISNIEKSIREDLRDIKKNLENLSKKV